MKKPHFTIKEKETAHRAAKAATATVTPEFWARFHTALLNQMEPGTAIVVSSRPGHEKP